jgi:hypothetical protein
MGAFAYLNYKREQARRSLLLQWATSNQWQFTASDDSWCDRWQGEPFGEGDHRRAVNVVTGQWKDRPFSSFDYSYQTHSSDGKGNRTTTTHRYAVTALHLPAYLPRLQVGPESLLSRVGHAFGMSDIELESEDFNRAFRVTATDPKFASDVLAPRTMQMLMSHPGLSWRIEGVDVICWQGGEQRPADVMEALATMAAIVDGIPSFVWHDHGNDAGSSALGGTTA